jgi:hypothetical protein
MAYVNSVSGNGSEPYVIQITGVTAGNTLIVGAHIGGDAATVGTITVTSDLDGSFTQVGTQVTPAGDLANQLTMWMKAGVTAGTHNITINATGTTLFVHAVVTEEGGTLTLDDVDSTGDASGNNVVNYSAGAITTTGTNRRAIGILGCDAGFGGSLVPGASETERQETGARLQLQDEDVPSAGAYTMQWTLGGTGGDVASIVAAFYVAAGGGSSAQSLMLRGM